MSDVEPELRATINRMMAGYATLHDLDLVFDFWLSELTEATNAKLETSLPWTTRRRLHAILVSRMVRATQRVPTVEILLEVVRDEYGQEIHDQMVRFLNRDGGTFLLTPRSEW